MSIPSRYGVAGLQRTGVRGNGSNAGFVQMFVSSVQRAWRDSPYTSPMMSVAVMFVTCLYVTHDVRAHGVA